MKTLGMPRAAWCAALLATALVALSGCTAPTSAPEPSSSPTDQFAWQQELLQEQADEVWDRIERQFPDAERPEAEFVEWITAPASGGSEKLRDCLNETSQSPPEESEVAHYVCFVQYPVRPEYPTEDANPKP
ncbi:MAG: hypothetical protein ACOH1M_07800 [Rhodoglobus sp.]